MNLFDMSEHAEIVYGFADAIGSRWLQPIPHGYCFSCDVETIVYDVLIGPSQPPRCASCFISAMIGEAGGDPPDDVSHDLINWFLDDGPDCP